jgi:hypothetical protein
MVPPAPAHFQQWWLPNFDIWYGLLHLSMDSVVHLLHINGNKPNNHPLCHSCGAIVLLLFQHMLAPCSSSKLTILRASSTKFTSTCQTFQSLESPKHTFSHSKGSLQLDGLPHHIWRVLTLVFGTHNIPLRAYQLYSVWNDFSSLTTRLTTPPWTEISISKCNSHCLSISMWSRAHHSFKNYSSRSYVCSLFHPKNHALLLCESLALNPKSTGSSPPLTMGQLIKGWSISIFILWVLQCHYRAYQLNKS